MHNMSLPGSIDHPGSATAGHSSGCASEDDRGHGGPGARVGRWVCVEAGGRGSGWGVRDRPVRGSTAGLKEADPGNTARTTVGSPEAGQTETSSRKPGRAGTSGPATAWEHAAMTTSAGPVVVIGLPPPRSTHQSLLHTICRFEGRQPTYHTSSRVSMPSLDFPRSILAVQ